MCIGAYADGAGPLGNGDNVESTAGEGGGCGSLTLWGMRTMAAPVDSIVAGDAIIFAIIVVAVVVSRNEAVEGGVGVAVPPLS